jgi:sugar lactone lactonase YvrE
MMRKLIICGFVVLFSVGFSFAGGVKIINDKAAFPEGPCWHQEKLFYVEYGGHTVMTWDGKSNQTFWRQDGCGPAAVVPMESGDLLVTCYDSNEIVRISSGGKTTASYKNDKNGQTFVGPNDFCADKGGGVYFSASGPWESAPIVGKIFYIDPKGSIAEVANDIHYANGLALSQDGKTLFCAESEASRVIQFSVGNDGTLSDRRLFVRIGAVDVKSGMSAYPDGLKIDREGNLYIGQFSMGRIVVVTPDGKLKKAIEVPSPSAPNLTLNADESVMYVMAVDDVNTAPYLGKVYEVFNK